MPTLEEIVEDLKKKKDETVARFTPKPAAQPAKEEEPSPTSFEGIIKKVTGTLSSETPSVIDKAREWLGVPYRWGGTTKKGVDCSGLVKNIYPELPRTAAEQYKQVTRVDKPEPGDLVFFKDTGGRKGITHVGIYIGNNKIIHAATGKSRKVIEDSLSAPYNKAHFAGFGRVQGAVTAGRSDFRDIPESRKVAIQRNVDLVWNLRASGKPYDDAAGTLKMLPEREREYAKWYAEKSADFAEPSSRESLAFLTSLLAPVPRGVVQKTGEVLSKTRGASRLGKILESVAERVGQTAAKPGAKGAVARMAVGAARGAAENVAFEEVTRPTTDVKRIGAAAALGAGAGAVGAGIMGKKVFAEEAPVKKPKPAIKTIEAEYKPGDIVVREYGGKPYEYEVSEVLEDGQLVLKSRKNGKPLSKPISASQVKKVEIETPEAPAIEEPVVTEGSVTIPEDLANNPEFTSYLSMHEEQLGRQPEPTELDEIIRMWREQVEPKVTREISEEAPVATEAPAEPVAEEVSPTPFRPTSKKSMRKLFAQELVDDADFVDYVRTLERDVLKRRVGPDDVDSVVEHWNTNIKPKVEEAEVKLTEEPVIEEPASAEPVPEPEPVIPRIQPLESELEEGSLVFRAARETGISPRDVHRIIQENASDTEQEILTDALRRLGWGKQEIQKLFKEPREIVDLSPDSVVRQVYEATMIPPSAIKKIVRNPEYAFRFNENLRGIGLAEEQIDRFWNELGFTGRARIAPDIDDVDIDFDEPVDYERISQALADLEGALDEGMLYLSGQPKTDKIDTDGIRDWVASSLKERGWEDEELKSLFIDLRKVGSEGKLRDELARRIAIDETSDIVLPEEELPDLGDEIVEDLRELTAREARRPPASLESYDEELRKSNPDAGSVILRDAVERDLASLPEGKAGKRKLAELQRLARDLGAEIVESADKEGYVLANADSDVWNATLDEIKAAKVDLSVLGEESGRAAIGAMLKLTAMATALFSAAASVPRLTREGGQWVTEQENIDKLFAKDDIISRISDIAGLGEFLTASVVREIMLPGKQGILAGVREKHSFTEAGPIGLPAAIVLDPLNYVPLAKIFGVGAKAVTKLGLTEKIKTMYALTLDSILLKRAIDFWEYNLGFTIRPRTIESRKVLEGHMDEYIRRVEAFQQKAKKLGDAIKEAATKWKDKELRIDISRYVDAGLIKGRLPMLDDGKTVDRAALKRAKNLFYARLVKKHGKEYANEVRAWYLQVAAFEAEIADALVKGGMMSKELADHWYMTHARKISVAIERAEVYVKALTAKLHKALKEGSDSIAIEWRGKTFKIDQKKIIELRQHLQDITSLARQEPEGWLRFSALMHREEIPEHLRAVLFDIPEIDARIAADAIRGGELAARALMYRDIAKMRAGVARAVALTEREYQKLCEEAKRSKDILSRLESLNYLQVRDISKKGYRSRFGHLEGMYVPEAIFYDLMHAVPKIESPAKKFIRMINNMWKVGKVALSMPTQAANFISNIILADICGKVSPHRIDIYADALKSLVQKEKNQYYQEAMKHGVFLQDTYVRNELREIMDTAIAENWPPDLVVSKTYAIISRMFKAGLSPIKYVAKKAGSIYEFNEQLFKMAVFIGAREKGLEAAPAAALADKALFNYRKIPRAVDFMRSYHVMPFIVFTYKAIPQIAKGFFTSTGKFSKYTKTLQSVEQLTPGETRERERKIMPEYMKTFHVRLPRKEPRYLDVGRLFPYQDIGLLAQTPVIRLASSAVPIGMSVFEAILNKSLFTGEEIVKEQEHAGILEPEEVRRSKLEHVAHAWLPSMMPPIPKILPRGGYAWEYAFAKQTRPAGPLAESKERPAKERMISLLGVKIRRLDPDRTIAWQIDVNIPRLRQLYKRRVTQITHGKPEWEWTPEEKAKVMKMYNRYVDYINEIYEGIDAYAEEEQEELAKSGGVVAW